MRSGADPGRPSLRWVLALGLAGLLLLSLSVLGFSVHSLVRRHLIRTGEYRLSRMVAEGLVDEFGPRDWRPEGHFEAPAEILTRADRLTEAVSLVEPWAFIQVLRPDGALVAEAEPRRFRESEPHAPESSQLAALIPLTEHRRSLFVRSGPRTWQVSLVPLTRNGESRAVVAVGLPWDLSRELLDALAWYFVVVGLITVLLSVALSRWLASRLSRPLEILTGAAERVASGELNPPGPLADSTREVTRLSLAFEKMVESLQKSRENQKQFVADASHELKTPLTAIGGMLQMLRRGAEKNPQDRELALSTMEREVERMGRLVGDLLALSRAEQRTAPPSGVVMLPPFLEEIASYLRLKRMDHIVEVDCPAGLAVLAQAESLDRVIRNLVNNSAKYTPAGKLIRLSARREAAFIRLMVEDEGIGIAPEDLDRVFDRFYRADPARSRGTGGTGLGLPIARALVDAMNGSLCLESEPGVGTRAIILLPAGMRSEDL